MKTVKRIAKQSPIILAAFLLAGGGLSLLTALLGYTFFPLYQPAMFACIAAIIILLTVLGVRNSNEKTKLSVVCSALVPLLAIFFTVSISYALDIDGIDIYIYILLSLLILLCSMIVLFACGRGKAVRISLGIIYSVLSVPLLFLLFLLSISFMANFGSHTVAESALSPSGAYLAEIAVSDYGAAGGRTMVNVTRQGLDINLLVGKLKKDPMRIYKGRWSEHMSMSLRWEGDEILYINEKKYYIKD